MTPGKKFLLIIIIIILVAVAGFLIGKGIISVPFINTVATPPTP